MPDKVIILKDGPPWGFRMTGGINTGSPFKISRVNNAGKAAKAGVREGFLIESINSASVDHLTSNEAQSLIRNSGDTLTLGVNRQTKANNIGQNNLQEHETDTKTGRSKLQTETETANKKSKRVRKRRRKKKSAESSEPLNNQQPTLPVKIIEPNQIQIKEYPKVEIIPAHSDLRIDELEWIKQNEALLIAELETRRQAGLPIQVVVRVEKITPSMPEYCQIIPDFCHLDVIKEETSASDEDPKKEIWECNERVNKSKYINKLSDDEELSDINKDKNVEPENILEDNSNETMTSEFHLERLESPSLVRESENLRFADIITTDNEYVVELETPEPLNNVSINVSIVESNESVEQNILNTKLNNEIKKCSAEEDIKITENQIQQKLIKNQTSNINITTNCSRTRNQLIPNRLLDKESHENNFNEDGYIQKNVSNELQKFITEEFSIEDSIEINGIQTQNKHIQNKSLNNSVAINCCCTQNQLITNRLLVKESNVNNLNEDAYIQKNLNINLKNGLQKNSSKESTIEGIQIYENQIQRKHIENQSSDQNKSINNCSDTPNPFITNQKLTKKSNEDNLNVDVCIKKNPKVNLINEQVNNLDNSNTKSQFINCSSSNDFTCQSTNINKHNLFSKHEQRVKIIDIPHYQNIEYDESSDDSTIKQCDIYDRKYKTHSKTEISIKDKLKRVARLIQDDTDDYEEIQSPQTTPRCVSIVSDADVDTDWVSFTLSDGESSKSLCLSPSQMRSGHVPSNSNETYEIIDLHNKFLNRTKSPRLSPHNDIMSPVDILGYSTSPSPSPSKSYYSSEVIDEACRLCGTSDEPLSDAECLVSLRNYRDTRSRLLDVIQKEQRINRSVIDRPSLMPTFIDTLSVPDNHTRELMYTEYMDKVKERENRLHNKVIRITKASRPLSTGTLQALNDIDSEFMTKARERLEKLGVDSDVDNVEMKEVYYPKHLVDIVPEEEVCIEEVQINGVWSPELKHKSLDLENVSRKVEKKQTQAELPPIWTPNASPTPERKAYKPVKFESPTLPRKQINEDIKKVQSKPPADIPALNIPQAPPPPPPLPLKTQGDENVQSTERRLPRVQSPTVTLLQKAREGQLPKGSAYLNSEEYNMDKENKIRGSTVKRNVETEEIKYASKREYDSKSDEKKQKKMVEISSKKYEGIGPTTKEGVPIVLRSEIKEPNQPKWYKQMYESLHKFQSDDEGVTVRYKTLTRGSRGRHGDGYLSEPEKGYDSDYGENKLFQNLNNEHIKRVSSRRSVSPVKCGQDRYKNQPRPIENYEPGHSSIAEKETKEFWDEMMNTFDESSEHQIPSPQNRSSSKKLNLAQALKETGYDSDSTLVFRRRDNQSQCLSPTEQKTAYKVIQNGGEIPFQGLRKTVPERSKVSPHKYTESEVTLQYRRPVRNEIKEEWSEEELANKQAEAMRRIYQEERRRKYLQELQDMSNRRHADNLLPSQKSPIPLNRYDDFLDESSQPPRSRTPEPKLVARALYNFVGQTSRELSFRKGDIIFVRKQIDKNWYEGEHNAMVGLFPFNYVEVIPYDGIRTTPHRPYEGQARAKFNFVAQTNMELSLVKGELVVLTRRVDNNWYEGRIGSRKGIFPVSYVTVLVEPGDTPNSSINTSFKPVASPASHSLITSNPPKTQHMYQPDSYNSSMPTRNSGTQTIKKQTTNNDINETLHVDVHSEPMPYRALYNYKPQNNDELELREGDVVFVMEKCDDGWYVGSSKRTGCFGTFPGNYVQRSI